MASDSKFLVNLGQVGGVPGIALGVFALFATGILSYLEIIPEGYRGPLVIIISLGVILIVLLTIWAWKQERAPNKLAALSEGNDSPAKASIQGGEGELIAESKGDRSPATATMKK